MAISSTFLRGVALVAAGALALLGAAAVQQSAAPAARADDAVVVVTPNDYSNTQETPAVAWNGTLAGQPCPAVAPTSAPWVFDIENKPYRGTASISDRGLELGVLATTLDSLGEKSRVLHYLATNAYGIPLASTLADMIGFPLSWTQTQTSAPFVPDYSVTMQIQVQKQIGADCVRAILLNQWVPGSGKLSPNLWSQKWWAVSPVNNHPVNSASSVPLSQIESEFGDWQVVAFGPNLGRDALTYSYAVQGIQAFGRTFVFGIPDAPPPPPPAIPADATPPAPTPGTPAPQIAPSSQPAPGGSIDVSFPAGTFEAFEWVQFTFYSTPTYATALQADALGALSGAVPVPASIPTGSHTLAAVGTTSGAIAVAAVTIQLAATGFDSSQVLLLAALGAAIALWGVVALLGVAVRRRAHPLD